MGTYITGSSGFLGKYLVNALKGDILSIPHELIHVTKLKPYSRFFFISTYGNMSWHDDENKIIKANILDLIHILKQTDFAKLKSFILISTSSVTRRYKKFYSHTKRSAEDILLAYAEKYRVPICIIRPYTITGVGEQKEHLIPCLIRSCIDGEKIPFVPVPHHDYIDVTDVVSGIIKLSKRHARGIFELGTGVSYSNKEVKLFVEKITNKKANINIVKNMRFYDSVDWVSRNFKARQFGWKPQKSLLQIIKEMVEDYVKTHNKQT